MEKLELKHIVGYLPYGLKIDYKDKIIELTGIKNYTPWSSQPCVSINKDTWTYLYEIKPILHPLSDLTKEIEVNGEKFVPIEYFEIGDENNGIEYTSGNIKTISSLYVISKYNIINDIIYLPFGIVQKLYEWHFDILGLIEKGLAIDIHTIK